MCQVRTLRMENFTANYGVPAGPLVSTYLTRLEVAGVQFQSSFFDFSGCPSLEQLDMVSCYFYTSGNIVSESLKRLSITESFWDDTTTLVRVPNLVSLRLDCEFGMALEFKSMPLLQQAFVRISNKVERYSDSSQTYCGLSISVYEHLSLSEAGNLALMSGPKVFIDHGGLKLCPTFSKLKSLLLNESWCGKPGFPALACILEHSPFLEKLCLQLFCKGPKHKLGIKGRRNKIESNATSGNLKIVEVKCEVADEGVFKILKFLATFGISFSLEEVKISAECNFV